MIYELSEIDGETAFPIFSVRVNWLQDGEHDARYPNWYIGLPQGTISNGTSWHVMKKEPVTLEQIQLEANEWWGKYSEEKRIPNIRDLKLEVKYFKNEVWNCVWFSHMTFDLGQDDKQILESFSKFVIRMEVLNEKLCYEQGISFSYNETPKGGYCLMGAEEKFRWRGEKDGDSAPCRCVGCKKHGVIRINH